LLKNNQLGREVLGTVEADAQFTRAQVCAAGEVLAGAGERKVMSPEAAC